VIRRLGWALYWRARAIIRLYRHATWTERAALTGYAARELVSYLPLPVRRVREAWIRLRGFDVLVAVGRYELGGYMDVWLQRGYEQLPDFRSRDGWLVVDVGANVGFFTLRQVALGARVVALEPNPDVRERLASTIERNGLSDRVQVLSCAAGRTAGAAELAVGAATVTGTVIAGAAPAGRDRFVVEVLPLDTILAAEPRVDLLKIDTEGAEVDVLAGAAATLRRTQRVVLEWHTAALRAEAGALLVAAGFHAVHAHGSIDYYRSGER
jgi:FkbM family methyltransferase